MKATGQNRIFVAFIVIHGNNHVGQGLAPCPADRQTKATYRVSPDWSGTLNGLRTYAWQYAGGDGSLTKFTFPSTTTSCLTYTYDALKRLTKRTTTVTGTLRGSKEYTYLAGSGTNGTTTLVSQLKNKDGSGNVTQSYTYTYDNVGNILTVSGSSSESYTYDTHDKLKKAVVNGVTYTYTYDVNGNILSKSDGTNTDTYTYGNSVWVDLLTAYNGHAITYDTPGNPTGWYDGAAMSWVNGRRLASIGATTAHGAMSFTYDADGLRLTKTVGGVTHRYLWQNGKLVSEAWGDKYLEFFYDEKGVPLSFLYRSSATADVWKYLYVTNLQGDVIGITTPDGESRAVYTYDPFGKPLTATGTMAAINPLRYRGYYYDTESGLYYLKSRYFDPGICRFINADSFASTGDSIVGCNMFAYCGCNPVNGCDSGGRRPVYDKVEEPEIINGQDLDPYGNILFGLSTIGFSGCEVIAIYNALLLIGTPRSFSRVKECVLNSIYNNFGGYGLFGLGGGTIVDIMRTLNYYNVDYARADYETLCNASDSSIMIVGFWTTSSAFNGKLSFPSIHTVAVEYSGGKYIAYNYYSNRADVYKFDTLDALLKGEDNFIYGFIINR